MNDGLTIIFTEIQYDNAYIIIIFVAQTHNKGFNDDWRVEVREKSDKKCL